MIDCQKIWAKRIDNESFTKCLETTLNDELAVEFPDIDIDPREHIAENIIKIYNKTQIPFVIFFDEYDLPIRFNFKEEEFQKYLDLLVSLFKNSAMAGPVALGYMTGILPIVREKLSRIDNFVNSSMLYPSKYGEYFGFTKEEAINLCKENNIDFDNCSKMFEGYNFGFHKRVNGKWNLITNTIFNPSSIISTFAEQSQYPKLEIDNPNFVVEKIRQFLTKDEIFDIINGKEVDVWTSSFLNDTNKIFSKDDLLTFLIHQGVLTYDYQEDDFPVGKCKIPNNEAKFWWEIILK